MQINRAEFLTNEAGGPQSFEFKPMSLNLLYTEDEQKKADLFCAISMVLRGNPDQNAAGNEGLKEGSIRIELAGKKILLKRDFESNQIEALNENDEETDTGDMLAGISKEMFDTLFFVGQDEGGSAHLADRSLRLSLLGQYASISEHSSNIDKAVKLVEEKLERYPFRGKTYKVDDLIAGLNRGKGMLEERLQQLEREREESALQIEELKKLEEELEQNRRTQKREEYFQLCLETAELDSRIMKVQQRLLHEAELKRELTSLADLSDFPISGQRKVQELWITRQARISDLQRHDEELLKSMKEAQVLEETRPTSGEELEQFSIEDTQQLYSIAKTMAAAQEEIEQHQLERAQEMRRVKDSGVSFDDIALLRKAVLAIDPQDLEAANKLSEDLKNQKERLQNLVELAQNSANQLKVAQGEIAAFDLKSRKTRFVLGALAGVSGIIVLAVLTFLSNTPFEVLEPIFLTTSVLSLIALGLFPLVLSSSRKDLDSKVNFITDQQNSYDSNELGLSKKISQIQAEGDEIARKYGLSSSVDLFKKLQTYSAFAGRLKHLDVIEQMLAAREKQLVGLMKDAKEYLEKARRSTNIITPAALTVLASEILWHKESTRMMDRGNAVVTHRKSERRFLEGELADMEGVLKDYFAKAKLKDPSNLEQSFAEFEEKAKSWYKFESINHELKRMKEDVTSLNILEYDLETMLNKLQHRRTDAWTTMQDLIVKYPDILSETIEDEEIGRMGQSDAQELQESLRRFEERTQELRSMVRAASKNFDEFHPKTLLELEVLERDLGLIKRNREALLLSRDSLRQVAHESKTSWSNELAEISEDLLSDMNLDVQRIDWDDNMEMTLMLRNHLLPLHEAYLDKKAPRGLRQQVNWITRMMLCRYFANRLPLPIVLDEPFCDLDDKRFAGCMDLLLRKILPHCQLIVLTCQPVRHKWYFDKLSKSEKDLISMVEMPD